VTGGIALAIILAHFIGDYWLQSSWMALNKTSQWWPAIAHGLMYTVPYAILVVWLTGISVAGAVALLTIGGTHALIDHYRWAKIIGWLRNKLAPRVEHLGFREAMDNNGSDATTPIWLSSMLLYINDNTLHLVINALTIYILLSI
jgi:hypothetical protein